SPRLASAGYFSGPDHPLGWGGPTATGHAPCSRHSGHPDIPRPDPLAQVVLTDVGGQALEGGGKRLQGDHPAPGPREGTFQAKATNIRAQVEDSLGGRWYLVFVANEHDPGRDPVMILVHLQPEVVAHLQLERVVGVTELQITTDDGGGVPADSNTAPDFGQSLAIEDCFQPAHFSPWAGCLRSRERTRRDPGRLER